jgi:hypothetical protein
VRVWGDQDRSLARRLVVVSPIERRRRQGDLDVPLPAVGLFVGRLVRGIYRLLRRRSQPQPLVLSNSAPHDQTRTNTHDGGLRLDLTDRIFSEAVVLDKSGEILAVDWPAPKTSAGRSNFYVAFVAGTMASRLT